MKRRKSGRKKKKEPKADRTQEGIDKLIAFRKQGETFRYLGVTMMVTGHWEILPSLCGCDIMPSLQCDYFDARGVLRRCSFGLDELPTLERENKARLSSNAKRNKDKKR